MIFIKRRAGETVVLKTPGGKILIQVLDGNELGIEMPEGVTVSSEPEQDRSKSWLPSRPKSPAA